MEDRGHCKVPLKGLFCHRSLPVSVSLSLHFFPELFFILCLFVCFFNLSTCVILVLFLLCTLGWPELIKLSKLTKQEFSCLCLPSAEHVLWACLFVCF